MPKVKASLGTELFKQYLAARDQAAKVSKVDGHRLAVIKRRVGVFLRKNNLLSGSYTTYSEPKVTSRWHALSGYLKKTAPEVNASEYEAAELYCRAVFSMYGETPAKGRVHPDADASFAFAVPSRMDREHPEYGAEVEGVIPLLRYVPEVMRAQMVKGLPPAIIDVYRRSTDGKRGYLVFTPVYGDQLIDFKKAVRPWRLAAKLLRRGKFPTVSRMTALGEKMLRRFKDELNNSINDAANFATRRLGADVVGLGAVLPGLSRFGTRLETDKTTTGHAGTIRLVLEKLHIATERKIGRAAAAKKVAIAGLGSIGLSIASVVAQELLKGEKGAERTLIITDKDYDRVAKAKAHLEGLGLKGNVVAEHDMAKVLEDSDLVILAITEKLKLGKLRHKRQGLRGKVGLPGKRPRLSDLVVIDDGQPGSVTREEAEKHGVNLMWVLGRSYGNTDELVRSSFRFGVDIEDVFGCEAEVASIAARLRKMREDGATEDEIADAIEHFAVRGPVSPDLVHRIGELFEESQIGPASPQSYGKHLRHAERSHDPSWKPLHSKVTRKSQKGVFLART